MAGEKAVRGFKMKKNVKIIAVVICALFLMSPLGVLAAGTTAISVSTNNPAQGDTFTVTATATESGSMSVKYNSNVLSVVGCDVAGFTQSAGTVNFTGTRGTITFKADNAGGSPISVSSNNASASSVVITVGASAETSATEDFQLDGVRYTVSEKFTNEEIPEGFTVTQFLINDKTLKGVTDGTTNLVYLKPVDNVSGDGKFFIYDRNTHSISNYFFLGKPDYYVIPSEPSELINEALRKGQITVDGQTVTVYTLQGVEDFVYVYGKCSDGTTGWYQYDVSLDTIQRVNEAIFNNVSSSKASDGTSFIDKVKSVNVRYIIAGAIFLLIVAVAIIVNIILKKRDEKADLIDGDEDYTGVSDKKLAKEERKRQKAAAKQAEKDAKAEEKAAKKEAKRAEKEAASLQKEKELNDEYMSEIYDEYGDFDIDRRRGTADVDRGSDTADTDRVSEAVKAEESIEVPTVESVLGVKAVDMQEDKIASEEKENKVADEPTEGKFIPEPRTGKVSQETRVITDFREVKEISNQPEVREVPEKSEAKAEPEPKVMPEVKTEAEPEIQPKVKQNVTPKVQPVPKAEPEVQPESAPEPQPQAVIEPQPTPAAQPQATSEPQPVPAAQPKPQPQSQATSKTQPEPAFWEDEKDIKRELKRQKKEEKKEEKKKNIFGDDELDLTKEHPVGLNRKKKTSKTGQTGIIDFNDL